MNKDYFCMAPFTHLAIDAQRRIRPCCMFYPSIYDDNYEGLDSIFSGKENNELRKRMLNGEKIESCEKCFIDESIGKTSYRQRFNERYLNDKNIEIPKIRELEIALGNKCNLKCVTCNSYYSSAWENDDNFLSNIIPRKSKIINNIERITDNFFDVDFKELRELKVLGGEPFLNNEYLNLFKKINASNVTLFIVTNNTIFPNEEWIESILKFDKINLNISIDGINEIAGFARYGTNFKRFEKNFDRWIELSKIHSNLSIIPHMVIHSLNVYKILDIHKWLGLKLNNHNSFELSSYDFLDSPEYLNIKFLPKFEQEKIIEHFNGTFYDDIVKKFLINLSENYEKIEQLLKYISFLRLRDELPECVNELHNNLKQWIENNVKR